MLIIRSAVHPLLSVCDVAVEYDAVDDHALPREAARSCAAHDHQHCETHAEVERSVVGRPSAKPKLA